MELPESVFSQRIKTAMAKFDPLIGKSESIMHIVKRLWYPHSILSNHSKLILIKQ